ncbi:MAG: hypothetical protein AAGU11_09145 [Syntrophobacteraceae bacterium]
METSERIVGHLKDLHLPTVRACFESEADLARRNSLSFEQYLLEVLEREMEARRQGRIERYLKTERGRIRCTDEKNQSIAKKATQGEAAHVCPSFRKTQSGRLESAFGQAV